MQTVYLISGSAGVGKSTTSRELAKALPNSAYISGDAVSHMHVNGREKPWESRSELSLIWHNIWRLTANFIVHGVDVVVDYVTFPKEAVWLQNQLMALNANVVYVVLWTDKATLLQRDQMRLPQHQMGERCLILIDEFENSGLEPKHVLDTRQHHVEDLNEIVEDIRSNERYRLKFE
ncbi:AAA family ATPase [Paenibacillus sp. LjRoot153]|uniref:AAA family ATPase n=1 Tax=Paenibacillus sp. LjRoot153 TaxID=3342270 RepID=UPI003ECF519F